MHVKEAVKLICLRSFRTRENLEDKQKNKNRSEKLEITVKKYQEKYTE